MSLTTLLKRKQLIWSFLSVCFVILLILSNIASLIPKDPEPGIETPPWLFTVSLIAPISSGPVRIHPAEYLEQELAKIGINSELDLISWAALGPRCTDQEVGMYSEGGYDICFFGMSLGIATDHPGASIQGLYSSGAIPSNGFNVAYWSNESGKGYNELRAQENEELIKKINTNLDIASATADLHDWQKIWYDVMPNIVIYNQYEVHAISYGFYGYDPARFPLASIEDQWFTGDEDKVVFATSTGPKTFNSIQATDIYSQYSASVPMDGLVGHTPSSGVILPNGTDRDEWMTDKYGSSDYLAIYPRMATSLGSYSEDGLQYNITVRDDVYWHDGFQFDAWDVAFSFQARLIPTIGASVYSNLLVPFGTDNKTAMSGNYSFVVEDKNSDGFFESISFQFVNIFAPWTTEHLGSLIYPEHILGDPINHGFDTSGDFDITQWLVQPDDWSTHSTSTGRISLPDSFPPYPIYDPIGYVGPIGTGSMIFKHYDENTDAITLEKFEGIMWDNSTHSWVENSSNNFYNIDDLTDMPKTARIITSSLDTAIGEMKSGNITIVDPQFTMSSIIEELRTEQAINPILLAEPGWQGLYMNPKFHQDGVRHLNRKGVRHAISHVIPRNELIETRINGLGLPAYTPLPVHSWAAIPEVNMIEYKQTLRATDYSKPESEATTAYDEYSINIALDWLETEGYNVDYFRTLYNPETIPPWIPEFLLESFLLNSNFYNGGMILTIIISMIYYSISPLFKRRFSRK